MCWGIGYCQGYSNLFADMCKRAGIPAEMVTGTVSGGGHAWAIAKISGKWYYFDPTGDRMWCGSNGLVHFCMTEKRLHQNREYVGEQYATAAYMASHPLGKVMPDCVMPDNDGDLYCIINGSFASKGTFTIDGIVYTTNWGGMVISQRKAAGWRKESGKWYLVDRNPKITVPTRK